MATMKDIIQSPLLLALGLFASSASGSKVVKGDIITSYVLWKKGRIQVVDKEQK